MAVRGKKRLEKTGRQERAPDRTAAPRVKSWAGLIVAAAVLVRLAYFVEYALSPLMGYLGVDDLYYLSWAGQIAAGDWLGNSVFEQGPLYAYLLAAGFLVVGDRLELILVLQMLTGVLVVLLVYDSARRLHDRTTAVVAGLTAAAFGPLVYYECMIMKSFLSPLLTMIALNAILRCDFDRRVDSVGGQTRSTRRIECSHWLLLGVAGAAVGLACLIQEYHALLLLPLGAWIWMSDRPDTSSRSSRAVRIGVLAAAALLCILPCTIRNWYVAGELVLVTAGGGEVFYIAHGPQARGVYNPPDFVLGAAGQEHEDFRREAMRRTGQELSGGESSRYWFREGLRAIAANPMRSVMLTGSKIAIMLNDYDVPDSQSYRATRRFVPALRMLPSFGWIGGLGFVGMATSIRANRRFMLPLGMIAVLASPMVIFYNFGRFRVGMMPLWIIFAAYAAGWIVRALRDTSSGHRWQATLALAAALAISAGMFHPLVADSYRGPDSLKVALLALHDSNYALAEEELRDVVSTLRRTRVDESAAVLDVAHFADVWQMMADICLKTGRPQEGIEYLRDLRRLPTRDDIRERNLRAAFMLLQKALRDRQLADDPSTSAIVRAEQSEICAELRQLRPDTVAFWAVSTVSLQDSADAAEIEQGLIAAWQSAAGEHAQQDRAWYHAGNAFLARFRGDRPAARQAARQALTDWPDHLLGVELRQIAEER